MRGSINNFNPGGEVLWFRNEMEREDWEYHTWLTSEFVMNFLNYNLGMNQRWKSVGFDRRRYQRYAFGFRLVDL